MTARWRILLQVPGAEYPLASYRSAVPLHQAERKAAELASEVFRSWEWAGDLPAIQDRNTSALVIIVAGSGGVEPCL